MNQRAAGWGGVDVRTTQGRRADLYRMLLRRMADQHQVPVSSFGCHRHESTLPVIQTRLPDGCVAAIGRGIANFRNQLTEAVGPVHLTGLDGRKARRQGEQRFGAKGSRTRIL